MKMETTTLYRVIWGLILGLYGGYTGIMEKKMETRAETTRYSILGLYRRGWTCTLSRLPALNPWQSGRLSN